MKRFDNADRNDNKAKYLQIFNYLLEFSKLRSKPVRDIENAQTQYPEIIWLSDIPIVEIFDCFTFPNYDSDSDYLLKINKPRNEPQRPSYPKLSSTLTQWIDSASLIDESKIPFLKQNIEDDGILINITEKPEVVAEFQKYLNNQLSLDRRAYKEVCAQYNKLQSEFDLQSEIYKRFFSIFNKVQQFGEEFELVFGIGLLAFHENNDTPRICRHLFTLKAEVTFDFSNNETYICVTSSPDGKLQIETDAIIDLPTQFDSNTIVDAENVTKQHIDDEKLTDDIFDNQFTNTIQFFSERLRADCQFKNEQAKPKVIPVEPTVYFAPALLMRKRDTRSFTAMYANIISQISSSPDNIDIPSLNDIITDDQAKDDPDNPDRIENTHFIESDNTIYFPKKYNNEQIEIVKKTRMNNKVLVQGPPGTGKSHTIANLICHLLANGKKVLVTAYTKRALEVLKDKLPPEFQSLTVNLLSGDSSSVKELEASVNEINAKIADANIGESKKLIAQLSSKLTDNNEKKAETTNKWLSVKEQSTRNQIINSNYQGKLIDIAERLENDKSIFSWFHDDITDIKYISYIPNIEELFSLHKYYSNLDCRAFELRIPLKEKLPSARNLMEYCEIQNALKEKYQGKARDVIIESNDYEQLLNHLSDLKEVFINIERIAFILKSEIINDYPKNLGHWSERVSKTNSLINEHPIQRLLEFERDYIITYPNHKDITQLKADALALLNFQNLGNKLSGMIYKLKKHLLSKDIKERLYFIEAVIVNGSQCDTVSEFKTVLEDLRIKQDIAELNILWSNPFDKSDKSYSKTIQSYIQLNQELSNLLNLFKTAYDLKSRIEPFIALDFGNLNTAKINETINYVDHSRLLSFEKEYKRNYELAIKYLSNERNHPLAKDLIKDLTDIVCENYADHLSQIDTLNHESIAYHNFIKLQDLLKQSFPRLVQDILSGTFESKNLGSLNSAICFKHAYSMISELMKDDIEEKLTNEINEFDLKEERLITQLSSNKAWLHVLESLNSNPQLRKHLSAWVLAVAKIGKTGRGPRAIKFRKQAQKEMEDCKDSIPCWIMPLYKVTEAITPMQGMYDFVIIDEASQLGADAIFLLYISKNIIIVGDDKQTNPEYVGINQNQMDPFIVKHLHDIPRSQLFGIEYSLFDFAKVVCNGMTVLREHFRCMPEIIEFSNKHFYSPEKKGLYPLRQYSENRLPPLMTEFCQTGNKEGEGQNIVNKVEAESIANKMLELISKPEYNEKTFGVIALQGSAQASIIERLLISKLGENEFNARKIICGNSASFQGDERDIMFLSLVTAHNHQRSALTGANDERRFNVAMSRAKDQVWLFHSVMLEDLSNANDLRYKLLDHFLNYRPKQIMETKNVPRQHGNQPQPYESWFEVDVYNDIVDSGYNVIPQYEVAKGRYRIDLVVLLKDGTKIAIECDGDKFHDAERFMDDLMRQKVLERCGWNFFRVRGAEYYSNRIEALKPLWEMLEQYEAIAMPSTSASEKKDGEIDTILPKPDQPNKPKIEPEPEKKKPLKKLIEQNSQLELFPQELSTDEIREWDSATLHWSTVQKPGYKYARTKKAWWIKKEDLYR